MLRSRREMKKIQERNPAADNTPLPLNEQCRRQARNAWLSLGLAGLGLATAVVMMNINSGVVAFGCAAIFLGLVLALAFGAERARLQRRYRRLQSDALVRWTTRNGQEVLIGGDAAYYDGVLIEWNGYSHVLTKADWVGGSIAFAVERYAARGGYVNTDTLSIPVPMVHKEGAEQALQVVRTLLRESQIVSSNVSLFVGFLLAVGLVAVAALGR